MIYLGEFKAGDSVFYAANFHNDTGTVEDPSAVAAQLRASNGTWSDLTAPAKQNSKVGHYGGTIDTTGFSAGQHVIRMAGTVTTGKAVATEFCFMLVANTAADIYARLGAPAGASVSADVAAIKSETATILADTNELQTNQGDWLTATGFSTHSAADVWAVATRALTDKAGFSLSAAGVDAIWDEEQAGHVTAGTFGSYLDSAVSGAGGGSGATAEEVWTYGTRALTDKAGFSLSADQAVNISKINGSADAAARLALSAAAIFNGAAIAGTLSNTQMTTNLTFDAASQMNGRILIFLRDTTTAALRGQATNITGTTAAGRLTFTALTTAPAVGDTFIIV
ncbi:MAG: hypothetical protein C4542_07365 [Dehalococcoidia bacterium]|nr:MAG: hypothetical protein C4542_07365 [Dehalococcoidia bacterium]